MLTFQILVSLLLFLISMVPGLHFFVDCTVVLHYVTVLHLEAAQFCSSHKSYSQLLVLIKLHNMNQISFLSFLCSKLYEDVQRSVQPAVWLNLHSVKRSFPHQQRGLSILLSRIMWCYWSVSYVISPRKCSANMEKSNMCKKQMLVDLTC